jgi:hypothetical protein
MCEAWKWIAIVSGVPLAALTVWTWLWPVYRRGWSPLGEIERVLPYWRWIVLDLVVCVTALTVYLAHCQ